MLPEVFAKFVLLNDILDYRDSVRGVNLHSLTSSASKAELVSLPTAL